MELEDAVAYIQEIYDHLLEQGIDDCPEEWLLALERVMEEVDG